MNHLHYGDNLTVLRESVASGSVDLIYHYPPFNSNANFNVLFKGPKRDESPAQIEAFDAGTTLRRHCFQELRHAYNPSISLEFAR